MIDEWYGLTIEDVRRFESNVNAKLEQVLYIFSFRKLSH